MWLLTTKLLGSVVSLIASLPRWALLTLLVVASLYGTYWQTERSTRASVSSAYNKSIKAADDARKEEAKRVATLASAAVLAQSNSHKEQLRVLQDKLDASESRKAEKIIVIKKVKEYVTEKADAACTIPAGFVWLHNSSLAGEDSGVPPSGPKDVDAPSGVKLSDVSSVTNTNNAECVARGEVIMYWQDWYRRSKEVHEQTKAALEKAAQQ